MNKTTEGIIKKTQNRNSTPFPPFNGKNNKEVMNKWRKYIKALFHYE
jgi:hypothetical protein